MESSSTISPTDKPMTPIERLLRNVSECVSNVCGSILELFDGLGPLEVGVIAIVVLGIASICLKGNPVRGA